ncbi:MAG: transposase [Chitinophagaceae bacterium]|nr:MAG: transposase [Chitinophagaceae bacterium]
MRRILHYSQLSYVQAVATQRKEHFVGATESALHYFGGVPKVLVPGNLKSAVNKADKYEPSINDDFLAGPPSTPRPDSG